MSFNNRERGVYYLIIESNGEDEAGTATVNLTMEGCTPAMDLGELSTGNSLEASVDITTGQSTFEAGCATDSGPEQVIAFSLAEAADLELSYSQTGDHVLGLYNEFGGDCDEALVECQDPLGTASGIVVFPRVEPGEYLLLVDANEPETSGQVEIAIRAL